MKTALLTGSTGFVGANLARRLLHLGHKVHLLIRPACNQWRINAIADDVRLHRVDLLDSQGVSSLVSTIKPDWIFHLAAFGAYSWQADLERMVQTNVVGTMNLVRAGLKSGFEVFVNTGSSSEYGFKDHAPSETEYLEPNSHYAVTKAAATLFCCFTARSERASIPTLRLYSVYGPYEDPSRLMPTLILTGLRGRLPPLVDPGVARDYVYVDDVTDAYLLSASRPHPDPGVVYNVGTGIQTSMREVVAVAKDVLDVAAMPEWGTMAHRTWDTNVWVADNRRIRQQLGWQPSRTFREGFRQMVQWFTNDPDAERQYSRHVQEV